MCEEYLLSHHKDDIIKLLSEEDNLKSYSIHLNFIELFENNPELGNAVLKTPDTALSEWNKSVLKVQCSLAEKKNCKLKKIYCRLHSLPICPELVRTTFPNNEDVGKFLEISGTVVRITAPKLLEFERQYICTKCKYSFSVKANYAQKNLIVPPKKCVNPEGCKDINLINFGDLDTEYCKDYQEIKVQESVTKLGIGSIPSSMLVTLEDDLVDGCKPGDSVTICGIVKQRWEPIFPGKKSDVETVLQANYIQVNNTYGSASVTPEIRNMFESFWDAYSKEPLVGRDIILKSICPQLFGLYFVKLATALVLAGGAHVEDVSSTGVRIRSESHLLLVGDPGTGKSHLLRFASKIIPRSVLTTGVGSTAAGLTVTAVKENSEWQLEGGALVMADGGICCIDEFNSMKEHDRTSIHEAMEQQTISVAKASIVCKLSTRCSILAACNPKGNLDPNQPLCLNIALASPLLSRFDLILLLRDTVNEEWDSLVADYILNGGNNYSKLTDNTWSLDLLQAYFKIIKKINPVLTEESNTILSSYYQCQRKVDSRNKSRTTVRLLDSLIRLSQGHAKLMYHSKVQIIDAVFAIILVDTAMENDGRLLNLNLNTHSTFSDNPMGDYLEMVEIVLNKLNLQDLLEQEREHLKLGCCNAKITKSRFFNMAASDRDNIPEFNNDSIISSTQENAEDILSESNIKKSNSIYNNSRSNSQNEENDIIIKQKESKNNFKTNKNKFKHKKRASEHLGRSDLNTEVEITNKNNEDKIGINDILKDSDDIGNINIECENEIILKTNRNKFKYKNRTSVDVTEPDVNNDITNTNINTEINNRAISPIIKDSNNISNINTVNDNEGLESTKNFKKNKIKRNEIIKVVDFSNRAEPDVNINKNIEVEKPVKTNKIDNVISQDASLLNDINRKKKSRKSEKNLSSKKVKLDKNIDNDLELLKCLPSVNDDIMNYNLNFDDDYSENYQENIVKNNSNTNLSKSKAKNSLKDLFGFKPKNKSKENESVNKENKLNPQASLFSSLGNENFDDIDLDL
ncbi:unnamed protein product [Brassicogethes aeneus]|uniref:DNA helicase MCM9 n=1 Tax=Brassicogethes aeneus TaxID=1431903 RepID=A0A9P0B3H5_BRAAE|nr:unnamed protein product [Brassicogethes aeneus]